MSTTTTTTRPPWAVARNAHHYTYARNNYPAGSRGHEARRLRAAVAALTAERRGDDRAAAEYGRDGQNARDALYRSARAGVPA